MKTKALFLSFVALLMSATLSAQTIIKGDMNDDKQVSIADVTSLVNVTLGKAPMETLSVECEPYKVDNSLVVGTWYAPDGTSFMFNADGTTTFPNGATYEFMPIQGRLLVYDAANKPVKVIPMLKAESEFLLTVDYATSLFTYYTKSNPQQEFYWYAGTTPIDDTNYNNLTIVSQVTSIPPETLVQTNDEYLYIVVPKEKVLTVYDENNFEVNMKTYNSSTHSFTNAETYVGDYAIYRSAQKGVGTSRIVVRD